MIDSIPEPITVVYRTSKTAVRPGVLAATAMTLILLFAAYSVPLKGQWIDRFLSEFLSKKYAQNVRVANVKIVHASSITFDYLQVKSLEGKWLIRAVSGRLSFKKIGIKKDSVREIEIYLKDSAFSKDYYKDYRFSTPFGFLVTKPMVVENLKILVTQKGRMTHVGIVSSSSKDVILSGSLTMDDRRVVKDNILIKFSPGMLLRAVL